MGSEIMKWIEIKQRGKSGIYPHQLALEVCGEFTISLSEAMDYVLRHIRDVINETATA